MSEFCFECYSNVNCSIHLIVVADKRVLLCYEVTLVKEVL